MGIEPAPSATLNPEAPSDGGNGGLAPVLRAPSSINVQVGHNGEPQNPSTRVDDNISRASPGEALQWVRIRGELLRQDEVARDRAHGRALEKWAVAAKIGMSGLAIGGGIALTTLGFGLPGWFCLGAGLYGLAPSFVNSVTNRVFGSGRNPDE